MMHVIKHRLRSAVIVTTKSGPAFKGVLFDFDKAALILRNVEHLHPGADGPTPVDGELLLLFADVAYMQLV